MIKKSIIFVLLYSGLIFGDSASDILKEIQDKYEDMKYLTAEFVQVETFKLTGSENETRGKIFIREGTDYRLETDDQTIVTDGKTVWTYSRLNNQVLIDRVKEGSGSLLPRDLLFKYPRDFYASVLREEEIGKEKYYVLKMDPREGVYGYIKSMKLWIEKESYLINKIEYTDFNDNNSSFEIRRVNTGTKLTDDLFRFDVKEGMNVVDLRL